MQLIRLMTRAFALAAVLLAALFAPALAQNVSERTQHFRFVFPEQSRRAVLPLMESADSTLERFGRRMGQLAAVTGERPIEVMVAANEEDFFRAQPAKGLDTWVAGTAYPARGLIILSLAPDQFFSLPEIFRHEISHIALYRAAGDRFMPRWLDEGLAILMAGEPVANRMEAAAGAAASGNLIPLSELTRGFPAEGTPARLAYAQSVLFLRYLQREHVFDRRLPDLVARVNSGMPFPYAFEATFSAPLTDLEARWAQGLTDASWWVTIVSASGVVWTIAAGIFVLAWWVVRRRRRIAMRALARSERSSDDEPWPPNPLALPDRAVSPFLAVNDEDERMH